MPDYSNEPSESQPQDSKHHPVIKPFVWTEKQIWEPLLAWAKNQAWLELIGILGNVGIIIAVVTYIGSEKQRREAEISNAWQTITSAYGQSGSGGRIQALEFLNASPGAKWRRKFPWFCAPHPLCTWKQESLDGINLAVESVESGADDPGAYLVGIQLPQAELKEANLQGAKLRSANLQGAKLGGARLRNTDLFMANLQNTDMSPLFGPWVTSREDNGFRVAAMKLTILEKAILQKANLEEANLDRVNLTEALLNETNLKGAELKNANLQYADLEGANLEGASFQDTILQGANLQGANLQGAKNLTAEQVRVAKNWEKAHYDSDLHRKLSLP